MDLDQVAAEVASLYRATTEEMGAMLEAQPRRLLQVAIHVAATGAWPPENFQQGVENRPPPLRRVRAQELRADLETMLLAAHADVGLDWLQRCGVLAVWLPEVEATVDFSQEAGRRHKDVWHHTRQVVVQAAPRRDVRWAALLHDIGKVLTRSFTDDGKVHFHGHAEVGARMCDDIARRLGFEAALRARVRFLVLHHLRANQHDDSWTDSAVRRFDREIGEPLVDLLDLSRADITSKRPGRRREALEQIDKLWQRIRELRELDAQVPPLPSGLGNAIMEQFGLAPGRLIGDLKRALEEAIERGEMESHRDAAYYLERLEAQGLSPKAGGTPGGRPA